MKEEKNTQVDMGIVGETPKVDRKEFLKTLGVGLGAIGLALATGQPALGLPIHSEKHSSRAEIQAFVRDLVRDPNLASKFLENPRSVAEACGIRLGDQDLANIHEGLMRLAADRTGIIAADQADKLQPGKAVLPKKFDKIYRDIRMRDPSGAMGGGTPGGPGPSKKFDKIYRDIRMRDPKGVMGGGTPGGPGPYKDKPYNDHPGGPYKEKPYNVRAVPSDKSKQINPADKLKQLQQQRQRIYQ